MTLTAHYEGEGLNPIITNASFTEDEEFSLELMKRFIDADTTYSNDGSGNDSVALTVANGRFVYRITERGEHSFKARLVKFDADICLPWRDEAVSA